MNFVWIRFISLALAWAQEANCPNASSLRAVQETQSSLAQLSQKEVDLVNDANGFAKDCTAHKQAAPTRHHCTTLAVAHQQFASRLQSDAKREIKYVTALAALGDKECANSLLQAMNAVGTKAAVARNAAASACGCDAP